MLYITDWWKSCEFRIVGASPAAVMDPPLVQQVEYDALLIMKRPQVQYRFFVAYRKSWSYSERIAK